MKYRIVFVDDNPLMHKLVAGIFQKENIEVLCYSDGITALEELSKIGKVDLFLLDIMMPTIDGYSLCKEIKKSSEYKRVDVIFVSAKNGSNNRILGYQVGAVNYLEKPFDKEELKNIVLSHLAKITDNEKNNDISIDESKRTVTRNQKSVKLTPIEYSIFFKLFRSYTGFTSRDTIERALPSSSKKKLNSRSLDNHISNLRKKLALLDLEISLVYGSGYTLIDSTSLNKNSA